MLHMDAWLQMISFNRFPISILSIAFYAMLKIRQNHRNSQRDTRLRLRRVCASLVKWPRQPQRQATTTPTTREIHKTMNSGRRCLAIQRSSRFSLAFRSGKVDIINATIQTIILVFAHKH